MAHSEDSPTQKEIPDRVWEALACPSCGESLARSATGANCRICMVEYRYSRQGQLDLRLQKRRQYQIQFELGLEPPPASDIDFAVLQQNTSPEVDFSSVPVPWHMTRELMSYFPKAAGRSLVLDLGCGSAVHRKVCEYAEFEYVGIDLDSVNATLLGDAHALPFKDDSFEFILSIAVLEHVRYPFVVMKEAYRVLKSGGKFIGTVAFLEPFHSASYYHHSHLGTLESLRFAGFNVERIAPSKKWSVLMAQAVMGLFPRMPRQISRVLILPLYLLHWMWWKLGYMVTQRDQASEKNRVLYTTGAFSFIAHKNAEK